jgi:CubicO group peptidase (beta-lactamase class C family)
MGTIRIHAGRRTAVWSIQAAVLVLVPLRAGAADLKTKIDRAVQHLITEKKCVGLIIGTVQDDRTNVFGYGRIRLDSDRVPDGDTVYEIGSITKTFTALMLADMAEKRLVKLDDPIRLYLPADVKVPMRKGKEITLLHLATHTSGLPRVDGSWRHQFDMFFGGNVSNPYKRYGAKELYRFLSTHELTRDIGAENEYSNVGMGLLGHLLARRANTTYEELLVKRICDPLEMKSTRLALSAELRGRLATAYVTTSMPAVNWDFDALAGCGAIRSTANDMLRYLSANLGMLKSPLQPAINMCHEVRSKTTDASMDQAMGWIIFNNVGEKRKEFWHNGGTLGYRSYTGFIKEAKVGVVVLSNCGSADDVDLAGVAILSILTERGSGLLSLHSQADK